MKLDMTLEDAANMLRKLAEMTATGSQNWGNFEKICEDVLRSAMDAGRKFGKEEPRE